MGSPLCCSVDICSCLFLRGLQGNKSASHDFLYREISVVPGELPSPLTDIHRALLSVFFSPYLSQMLHFSPFFQNIMAEEEPAWLTPPVFFGQKQVHFGASSNRFDPTEGRSLSSPHVLLLQPPPLPKPCHTNKIKALLRLILEGDIQFWA